jgi:hypothetical protein
MTPCVCPHESELLEWLLQGRPSTGSDRIEQHFARCGSCRELVSLAELLGASRQQALAETALPTASQVWWRARVRARLEAAEVAERPISVAQGLAAAATAGVAVSVVGLKWVAAPVNIAREIASRAAGAEVAGVVAAMGASPLGWALLIAGVCVLVVLPLAAVLTLSQD